MRVGVNSGQAILREIGGDGYVAYPLVGDTVNTGSRLEGLAPAGGVLIGTKTYRQLPAGAVVEEGGTADQGQGRRDRAPISCSRCPSRIQFWWSGLSGTVVGKRAFGAEKIVPSRYNARCWKRGL